MLKGNFYTLSSYELNVFINGLNKFIDSCEKLSGAASLSPEVMKKIVESQVNIDFDNNVIGTNSTYINPKI